MSSQISWPQLLTRLIDDVDLETVQARWAMDQIMTGSAAPAAIGGFLIALKKKGESLEEVSAFVSSILAHAVPLDISREALDIVGTGGDRSGTVNISSMAAIVVAGAGVPVIKHGNRAVSSRSGSSDFFEALGVNIDATPEATAAAFAQAGIGFAFAQRYHQGFRHAGPVRKALGVPTVFNFLGPLCNPARPRINALGVADRGRVDLVAALLSSRGDVGLVFRGEDGLDELTTTGPSRMCQVDGQGGITEFALDPAQLGIKPALLEDLVGGDAEENAAIGRALLAGETGSVRDIVLLNAAAGLVAADLLFTPETAKMSMLDRFAAKLEVATESIDSGAAAGALDRWIEALPAAEPQSKN
ncbi:anthranilate phosphoribosyltransferase [Pseudoclavibacter sp. 13-3]|uniref:anthranilate phosphoribosyltransferase n=1 Tax=Pseudoclavibacter sp. 13-3 TaxID=2901228 RepID=UPI001E5DE1FB|nr:anthranilate phosphoribosyltransferase [Pseudoclavibacter sp. 13-3]MCD7101885.1 anthranilate phosphoribosyltransferase [Pseudoclavibacter sp. 13-3]